MTTIMLMLVTVVFGAHQTAAPPGRGGERGRAGTTPAQVVSIASVKELRVLAAKLDPDVRTGVRNKAQFGIFPEAFVFYKGDPPALGDDVIGPVQQPILIPLAQIIQIDNLKNLIEQQSPGDLPFWKFYLEDAVTAVQKGLDLIASGEKTGDERNKLLLEYGVYISLTLEKGAKAFAVSRNLQYRRGNILQLAAHKVPVTIVKEPPTARVFVIPASLFTEDNTLAFGWREVLETKPTLGGRYYYKVDWPDGTSRPPTPFTVDKAGMVLTINK